MTKASVAVCHQVTTVDRTKLTRLIGSLPPRFLQEVEEGLRVAGSRVSLDSIVHDFREGLSPESITENYPTLTLEQVYGAIAYYLANQGMLDEYLRKGEERSLKLEAESRRRNADFIARSRRAGHESQMTSC
ncbi:MAG: DUF433 domain-containing protein [Bryobacteraceae bacterium]|nr:DUF433 domain-containing protein [Bryobacteraceae bacterium]